jgi:nucleotide-binding universal stress UspA family protein
VTARVVAGPAAAELITAAAAASLTIVGSRGRGGMSVLLLGSVSEPVSRRAGSPVAVVHPLTRS